MTTITHLVRASEAAAILGVTHRCLDDWRRRTRVTGKLVGPPWVRIGVDLVRYDRAELERYIHEGRIEKELARSFPD